MSISTRRLRVLPVIAALLLATACGGDQPEAQPDVVIDGESSAPAGDDAAGSDLPDGVPTEPPPRPEDTRSAEGAKVFAQYVGNVWWYTTNSFDPEPLRALSPRGQDCQWCRDSIRSAVEVSAEADAEGLSRVPTGDLAYRYGRAASGPGTPDTWTVTFETKAPAVKIVDRETGDVVRRFDQIPWTDYWVDMRWKDGGWELVTFRFDSDG